jgi:hypothetical protein
MFQLRMKVTIQGISSIPEVPHENLGDFKAEVRRNIFSNQHSGIKVYVKIIMIMGLEL